MNELLYKEEVFQLVGFCMEIHRELGKGHDEITYKGVILPHYYYADFVVWDKILFEAKAVEKLSDSHIKQVLNYLAASKLRSVCWSISVAIPWSGKGLFYETPISRIDRNSPTD